MLWEPLILLAVDRSLGGVYAFGPPARSEPSIGPAAGRLLDGPVVRVPASAAPEHLTEHLDVPRTLACGRPVYRPGLVARARAGILVLEAADVLAPAAVAQLAALVDMQPVNARPVVWARGSARPRPADPLAARCALWWDLSSAAEGPHPNPAAEALCATWEAHTGPDPADRGPFDAIRRRIAAARTRAGRVPIPDALLAEICRRVRTAGYLGQSLDYFVARAARARAAWLGRTEITQDDVAAAWRWVVAPRQAHASRDSSPSPPEAGSPDHPGTPPVDPPSRDRASHASVPGENLPGGGPGSGTGAQGDGIGGAGDPPVVVVPPGALAGALTVKPAAARCAPLAAARRPGDGRPEGRPSRRREAPSLAVVPTLLAALPYQRLRPARPPLVVRVLPDDLRWRRRRPRPRALYILAVDGSGSMAQNRIHLAKGAALSILQGAYRERRHVALIDFRHRSARVLCPPGRSTALLRREICVLPSGGGTPLPAALGLSVRLARRWRLRHPDSQVHLVLFTDGKANVPLAAGAALPVRDRAAFWPAPDTAAPPTGRDGDHRRQAWADVERMASFLRAAPVDCTIIDTGPPGTADAVRRLAGYLGARVLRLARTRR